jgi:hypothetical protein
VSEKDVEVRAATDADCRREALVELFKRCVREVGITDNYDADIEYMEDALEQFVDTLALPVSAEVVPAEHQLTPREALVLTRALSGIFLPEDAPSRPDLIRKLWKIENRASSERAARGALGPPTEVRRS